MNLSLLRTTFPFHWMVERKSSAKQLVYRLMPESALTTTKEKQLTSRQWFESRRAAVKGAVPVNEESEEDEEYIDFDEDDEEDLLEHYLAERFEGPSK